MKNPIVLPIPSAAIALLGSAWTTYQAQTVNSYLFNTSVIDPDSAYEAGDYLVLYPKNGGYQRVYEKYDDSPDEIIPGVASCSPTIFKRRRYYGFTFDTQDGNDAIEAILGAIAENAEATNFQRITVYDYCKVDTADLAQGYSIRTMRLVEWPSSSGSIRAGLGTVNTARLSEGYQFKLMEFTPRVKF